MDSKEYSWTWVTASQLLTDLECELVYALLVPIYNGTGTTGDVVTYLVSAVATQQPFSPPVPIYCRKGLYITKGSATTGVLVVWRHL
jgi:hypothetical protein